jgi:polyhydroxybutyrate depolymerase
MKKGRPLGLGMLGVIAGLMLLGQPGVSAAAATADNYGGRSMSVYVPARMPPAGERALVVMLHGAGGNGRHVEQGMSARPSSLDGAAEKNGFVVAYLNGTPIARALGPDRLGWNAGGGCCGQPALNNVDDVGYIKGAVDYLAGKYGIDRSRIFGMGDSNGAMMTQRLMCETSLYAAAVAVSGPLTLNANSCPAARGKRILAIHGADDQNVPMAGGQGSRGASRFRFTSQEQSRQVFANSGASFTLISVPGAGHRYGEVDDRMKQAGGVSVVDKAVDFFGLGGAAR